MLWYDKWWYFDKKQFLKAYDLLLFPEKRLNLILGVPSPRVQCWPCYLQKQFSKVLPFFFSAEQLPNIIMDIKQISMQWKSAKKYKLGGI